MSRFPVKLRIKSFRVPELFIEIPETATIGSLKVLWSYMFDFNFLHCYCCIILWVIKLPCFFSMHGFREI